MTSFVLFIRRFFVFLGVTVNALVVLTEKPVVDVGDGDTVVLLLSVCLTRNFRKSMLLR